MNKSRTILSTLGLSIAVVLGAGTVASAADGTPPTTEPSAAHVAERCAKVPTALTKVDAATTRINDRIAKLAEAKAKAATDGNAKRSERIGKLITRLQGRLDKVAAAKTRIIGWQTEHCAG